MRSAALIWAIAIVAPALSHSSAAERDVPPGLALRLALPRHIALVGEPVVAITTLENVSAVAITVKGSRIEKDSLSLEVTDQSGKKLTMLTDVDDREPEEFVLEPGEFLSKRWNLLDGLAGYRAGAFTIRALFASGKLSSEQQRLRIMEPTAIQDVGALAILHGTAVYRRYASYGFIYQRDPEACRKIVEKFPASAYAEYALYYLARHHKEEYRRIGHLRDFEEASRLYREVVELHPAFVMRDSIHLGMGEMYLKKNDLEKAMAEFIAVIESSPGTVQGDSAKQLLKLMLEKAMGTEKP